MHVNADGSATFRDPYGGQTSAPTFECDWCGREETYDYLFEALARGATGRECAVMWACRDCGPKNGLSQHTEECTHE